MMHDYSQLIAIDPDMRAKSDDRIELEISLPLTGSHSSLRCGEHGFQQRRFGRLVNESISVEV